MKGFRVAVGALVAAFLALANGDVPTVHAQAQADPVAALLRQIEQAALRGSEAFQALLTEEADPALVSDFAETEFSSNLTRISLLERDRSPLPGTLPGDGYQVVVDAFLQSGDRARVSTWQVSVKRGDSGEPWKIDELSQMTTIEAIYKLSLNPAKQFAVRNLTIAVDDLELTLPTGEAFVAEIDRGTTGVVLLGRGRMKFSPAPAVEKGQVKIFAGAETLDTPFEALFVRVNPNDFDDFIAADALAPVAVDPRELRRAEDVFREESAKSFGIDLGDMTRESWSLLPGSEDFLAEIRTRRFETLTYARSSSEPEDINLFERKRHKTISLYTSSRAIAARGAAVGDGAPDFDVDAYTIDLTFSPDKLWLEGRAQLDLRVRASATNSVTLSLASPLTVRSIWSEQFGHVFGLRVKNQDRLVINLPATMLEDTPLSLTIEYSGRLEPQAPDREVLAPQRGQNPDSDVVMEVEPSFLYTTGSDWYPRPVGSGYAKATLHLTVPAGYGCVATGEPADGSPTIDGNERTFTFEAIQPIRYLSFVVSRFSRAATVPLEFGEADVALGDLPPGRWYRHIDLRVESTPRQMGRARELAERAADIIKFYEKLIGDVPFPSFTLAVVEHDLPGGHSPGYFAALNQPLPTSPLTWRNDPAAFANFGDFFVAHEIAHQWWGQAVGWSNYHDQWLSEGLAQYFAALYAQHSRGNDTFAGMMRQMRKWAIDMADQGPIALGSRLGHIQADSRVFRAIAYNKSAAVLQMLRRLLGDDTFFRGLRRFYRDSRFQKVSTADFREAMEAEAGHSLERFFDRWVKGSTVPRVKFSYSIEGTQVVLHAEQVGDIFDVPLMVTLQYADRKTTNVTLLLTDRTADLRVPLAGTLRSVDVSRDDGTIAEIIKN